MAVPAATNVWEKGLEDIVQQYEDGSYVKSWYLKSRDRKENPVLLSGFGETMKTTLKFLVENLISLNVSEEEIQQFVKQFRNYTNSNKSLNEDENNLLQLLEFYQTVGDYPILLDSSQTILNLFFGDIREGILYPPLKEHFQEWIHLLKEIRLEKYFYTGLNDDAKYVFFRRIKDRDDYKQFINTKDNLSGLTFLKQFRGLMTETTLTNLIESLEGYESNKDKEFYEYAYYVEREKLFIQIVLLMISHLKKYITTPHYNDDTIVEDSIKGLVGVLEKHHNLNRMLNPNPKVTFNGFAKVHEYIKTFDRLHQLTALEIFYKKLLEIKEQGPSSSLSEFWDRFDTIVINKNLEEQFIFRSYKYRSDFEPSAILIEGSLSLDPIIYDELDKRLIYKENESNGKGKKFPFSAVIGIVENDQALMYTVFEQFQNSFGYDVSNSLSPSRTNYTEIIEQQREADINANPIPDADMFEPQFAADVPPVLSQSEIAELESDAAIARTMVSFHDNLERYEGYIWVSKMRKDIKQIIEVNREATVEGIEKTRQRFMKIMNHYKRYRPTLVSFEATELGSSIDANYIDSISNRTEILTKEVSTYTVKTVDDTSLNTIDKDELKEPVNPITSFFTLPNAYAVHIGSTIYFVPKDESLKPSVIKDIGFGTYLLAKAGKYLFLLHKESKDLFIYDSSATAKERIDEFPLQTPIATLHLKELDDKTKIRMRVKTFTDKTAFILSFLEQSGLEYYFYDFAVSLTCNQIKEKIYLKELKNMMNTDFFYGLDTVFFKGESEGTKVFVFNEYDPTTMIQIVNSANVIGNMTCNDERKVLYGIIENKLTSYQLFEVAKPPPLVQPELPKSALDIDDWWKSIQGSKKDVIDQYKVALEQVKPYVTTNETVTYDNLVALLDYPYSLEQYKSIFIPILTEWYSLIPVAPMAGGNRLKLTDAFINASTNNLNQRRNLIKIANHPSDSYRDLIQEPYFEEKPLAITQWIREKRRNENALSR